MLGIGYSKAPAVITLIAILKFQYAKFFSLERRVTFLSSSEFQPPSFSPMKYPVRMLIMICSWWCIMLQAQESTNSKVVLQNATTMQEALDLRSEMAARIASDGEQASDALQRLKTASFPSGLRISQDAGFAYAAIDIGQRLIVLHKMPAAALFFEAAEAALDRQVQQTPDTQAKDKAQYLQKLALIRGNYLNKAAEAKAAIDAAIQLQPDVRRLKRFRSVLSSDKATTFDPKSGNGEGK